MSDPVIATAVIVDDEPAARDVLRTFVSEDPRVELVGEAANGREAVTVVEATRPHLLFLDVQMPDLDGFGVLEALETVPPAVVFVTAHDRHALRAFEVHALGYILKPFGRPRFTAALDRALASLEARDALDVKRTLERLVAGRRLGRSHPGSLLRRDESPPGGLPRRLGVRLGQRTVLVDVERIDWIEADGDYARLHVGDAVHLVSERMHVLEELLDPGVFHRIHRSSIVNLRRVQELRRDADGGGTVVLGDGVHLRVARTRWDALEHALGL